MHHLCTGFESRRHLVNSKKGCPALEREKADFEGILQHGKLLPTISFREPVKLRRVTNHADYFAPHFIAVDGGVISIVAVQPWLGLLPQWRPGIDCAGPGCFAAAWPHLKNRQPK
jgi:hypothetical protein